MYAIRSYYDVDVGYPAAPQGVVQRAVTAVRRVVDLGNIHEYLGLETVEGREDSPLAKFRRGAAASRRWGPSLSSPGAAAWTRRST